jgi:hypothetical protein
MIGTNRFIRLSNMHRRKYILTKLLKQFIESCNLKKSALALRRDLENREVISRSWLLKPSNFYLYTVVDYFPNRR